MRPPEPRGRRAALPVLLVLATLILARTAAFGAAAPGAAGSGAVGAGAVPAARVASPVAAPRPVDGAPATVDGAGAVPADLVSRPVPAVDITPSVRLVRADATGVEFLFEPGAAERVPAVDALGEAERLRFARLEHEGVSVAADPGQPEVLTTSRRVLIPAGQNWRLSFSIEAESRVDGLRLPRRPLNAIRADSRRGLVAAGAALYPALAAGEWPEAPVMAGEEELRGQRLLVLSLAPFQYDGGRRSARLFERLRVRVDFTPGAASRADAPRALSVRPGTDPLLDGSLAGLVLNPAARATGPGFPRPADGTAPASGRGLAPRGITPGIPATYFSTTTDWVKLQVRHNGIYRVTGQALQAAGVSLSAIDPATLRLFTGTGRGLLEERRVSDVPDWGQPGGFGEVACRVEAGADGRFDAGDALYFYGLAVDNFASWFSPTVLTDEWVENDNTDTNIYWVTWGAGFPAAPLRVEEVAAAPQTGAAETTEIVDTRHFETNDPGLYDPLPREKNVRWEKWWWQLFDDSSAGTYWDLALPDVDTAKPASLFARWWGSNRPNAGDGDPFGGTHFLNVTVNGGAPTNAHWQFINRYDMTIPSFTPTPSTRVVATIPRLANAPNRVDQVLLAWFEVTYTRRLNLPATGDEKGRLWWSGPRTDRAVAQPAQFRVGLSGTLEPEVYDVSDPRAVRRLTGGVVQTDGGARSLGFRVDDLNNHRFLVTNADGYLAPAGIARDTRPTRWLRDTVNAADYLVITYDDFLPAAQELADWRRTHLRGLTDGAAGRPANVAVVRVSDVYDEFSGGLVDPTAIRNFVQYAFAAWNGGGGAAAPSYLVLIGDASRDTRDREQTGVKNLLPTWENGYDAALADQGEPAQFASDDFFVRLAGPNDRLADLIVGRIPATTAEMAQQIVRGKVIHSEQPTTANADRCRAILTADDVCQAGSPDPLGFTHILQSEDVDRAIPQLVDRRKIYLYDYGSDCSILYKPAAKRDLLTEMNRGSWLINFIGHGSDQQLYDEKILEVPDVATLDNLDALPLLIAASCSVGKFDRANSEGLAEALIKAPNGGCLATMAGTHLTYSSDNSELNIKLMNKLFPDSDARTVTMGQALWQSKIEVTQSTPCGFDSSACDRQRKFLLLGDPGSPAILPGRTVRFTSPPDSLRRGATVEVTGDVLAADGVTVDAGYNGTIQLRVEDHPEVKLPTLFNNYTLPGARLFEGEAPVRNGHFSASFVVPVSLRGGSNGRLRLYASSSTAIVVEAYGGLAPLAVGGRVTGAPDTEPPQIALTLPSGRAQPGQPLQVAISDTSGINLTRLFDFRSLLLTIEDDAGRERFRSDITDGFAYDPGSHTRGRVVTDLPSLAAGRYTVRVTATDNFNNRGEGTLALQLGGGGAGLAVRDLFNFPNPFTESTSINFTMSEAGTAKVRVYSVSGRRVWQREMAASAGQNFVVWDGRDDEGDAVANGVYLVRVQLKSGSSGRTVDALERMVRVR